MSDNQHCGGFYVHSPHTWYSPSTDPKSTMQEEHDCPGTKKEDT